MSNNIIFTYIKTPESIKRKQKERMKEKGYNTCYVTVLI